MIHQIKGKKYTPGAVYGNMIPPEFVTIGERQYSLWDMITDFVKKSGAVEIKETGEEKGDEDEGRRLAEYILGEVPSIKTDVVLKKQLLEQAEARLQELTEYYQDDLEYISIYTELEDDTDYGYDDDVAYIARSSMRVIFSFVMSDEWAESEDRKPLPSYRDYDQNRRLGRIVYDALSDENIDLDDPQVEVSEELHGDTKFIQVQIDSSHVTTDLDSIDTQLNEYSSLDSSFQKIEGTMKVELADAGYLETPEILKLMREFDELEFKNIDVVYDEDDLSDGILIRNADREAIFVGKYPYVDPITKKAVYDVFKASLEKSSTPGNRAYDQFQAKIRLAFKMAARADTRKQLRQLDLPGMSSAPKKDLSRMMQLGGAMSGISFKLEIESPPKRFGGFDDNRMTPDDIKKAQMKKDYDVGYHFGIEFPLLTAEDSFSLIKDMALYLDNNISDITRAVRKVVDEIWKESKSQAEDSDELVDLLFSRSPSPSPTTQQDEISESRVRSFKIGLQRRGKK